MSAVRSDGGLPELLASLGEAAANVMTVPLRLLTGGAPARSRRRLRASIAEVRRLLRVARGAGVDEDLVRAISALAARRRQIERAIVVWVDLIEVLVQAEERRYGPRAGLGPIKAAEAREALRYLLTRRRFAFPGIPEYLQPLLVDIVAGWFVDAIVRIANRYGLWLEGDASPASPLSVWYARVRMVLGRLLRPIGRLLVRMAMGVRRLFRRRVALPPELMAALQAAEREGLLASEADLVGGVVNLLKWIGQHRDQLVAAVEIAFAAVQEAEGYFSLTGPEKRAYARDLVLAALDEMGFKQRAGLLFGLVDSAIGGAIESAVHLFHKRGVFQHRYA